MGGDTDQLKYCIYPHATRVHKVLGGKVTVRHNLCAFLVP